MYHDADFADPIVAKPGRPSMGATLASLWFGVCLVNMIVPALLGLERTRGDGRAGMFLGIVAVLGLGFLAYAGGELRESLRTVTYGGWVVAATQIVPLLQFVAGGLGVGAADAMGWTADRIATENFLARVDTLAGGLIATLVTGGLLIAVAGFLGFLGRLVHRPERFEPTPRIKPIPKSGRLGRDPA